MNSSFSIGIPSGRNSSACGYCSPPGERSQGESSYQVAGFDAVQLTCQTYQGMIDRGWRRSGTWCYKPDLRASCCPQYTIRLDALQFKPSKSQRKVLNRWNRYVLEGEPDDAAASSQKSRSGKSSTEFVLPIAVHASEISNLSDESPTHRFEVTLEPSTFTEEKFTLYKKYQSTIHNDHKNSSAGFKRFLVESPLKDEPIPYPQTPPPYLPRQYGSYHQLYRIDGKLMAMAVLDILPTCVSSVYFMYDIDWEDHSLGKLSAMREVSLAREIHEAGVDNMLYLYMGFYIHSCPKMKYKGDYSPSFLADPETYEWFPLESCRPSLDTFRYACFSHPSHSSDEVITDEPDYLQVPLSSDDEKEIRMLVASGKRNFVVSLSESPYWQYDEIQRECLPCIHGLGIDLSKGVIFKI
ncbi:hypothetical protein BDN72DRAFT_831455 [Pluteus cervinus]|uniref:Uncharacterized protein n=1 Tax=Pluteus cervinus TaxID=181527 RepID=A0ACD3BG70_9AGAR|nr:hypothetical protein BDN72DRAFT_831455 [Pluteus cervinus]